jgi:ribosomal protein S18 acetylase RimI-like enzyme
MSSDLRRAIAFEEALRDRAVDRIEPFRFGDALFTESLPRVWDANLLRVERADGARAAELAAEADRVQRGAGLLHRKIAVLDEGEGERLAPGFAELGWSVTRFLFMAHPGDPAQAAVASVVEVDRDLLGPLRERIARDEPWARAEEDVRQVRESAERIAAAGKTRHFAVLEDGAVASCADLYSDGRTAQIEDVATLPEFRGRGYASAVVLTALAAARRDGHDFVFLVADDGDWPKELYAKLGFEPLGRTFEFLRKPDSAV